MLANGEVNAMVPTKDLQRARSFYEGSLGLTAQDVSGSIRYDCGNGSWFLLYETYEEITAKHTVANWTVADLRAEVGALKSKGVTFVDYDTPNMKTVDSIMEVPELGKVAWFKDPDGNLLGMVEMAA